MSVGRLALVSCIVISVASCGGSTKDTKSASPDGKESGGSGAPGPAEVGKASPDLAIQTVNGKGAVSNTSLTGKIAVVDFWATWCGPCKQSFPKLEELSKKHGDKVQFLGVSVDDDKDGVADFAKTNGATFPIAWDDKHSIANRWKVESMPTTFILDSTGTVRYVHAGYHDDEPDQIDKELVTLVSEPPGKAKAVADKGTDKPADKTDKPTDKPTDAAKPTDGTDTATDDPPPKKKPTGKGAGKKPGGKKPPGKKPPPKKDPNAG